MFDNVKSRYLIPNFIRMATVVSESKHKHERTVTNWAHKALLVLFCVEHEVKNSSYVF
jgi:hypothetical protein